MKKLFWQKMALKPVNPAMIKIANFVNLIMIYNLQKKYASNAKLISIWIVENASLIQSAMKLNIFLIEEKKILKLVL